MSGTAKPTALRGHDPAPRVPITFVLSLSLSLALSLAMVPLRGAYRADAMVFLFLALGIAIALVRELWNGERGRPPRTFAQRPVVIGLGVVVAALVVVRVVDSKLLATPQSGWPWLRITVAAQGVVLATYLLKPVDDVRALSRRNALRFAVLGLLTLVACLMTLRLVPLPPIDVWEVQTQGARALLAGDNPFEVVRVRDTAPGSLRADIPYVYPPLQVLLTLPSVLLGDVRLTMVVAVLVIGAALRRVASVAAPNAHPLVVDAPALFVWTAPKLFYIVEMSWIDPVQLALIATACAFWFEDKRLLAAAAFGLALASKQSMFWVLPIAAAHFRFGPRQILVCLVAAGATIVPFALWDFGALFHSNVGFLNSLTPRDDALTFVLFSQRVLGFVIPHRLGFALAALAVGLVLWRRGRPHRFGAALALTYFFFFAFNKWAFANYYFFIGGAAALGAATSLSVTRNQPA